MPTIKLQTSDEEIIEVDEDIAKCSDTIKTKMENLGTEEVILLPRVDSAILRKVVDWVTHHKDDLPQLGEPAGDMSPWDADYFDVEPVIVIQIIMAAHYLDIRRLLLMAIRAAVRMICDRIPH